MSAVSAPTPYCRPRVTSLGSGEASGRLQLTGCRHPLVELQDGCSYIPNDVKLEAASLVHIITGPNMGGKSTYLRSVGCAVLMAQCGSFVAADSAELSVVDSVMVRIGASDCQVEGVSTFMSEMLETQSLLATATPASLVLIGAVRNVTFIQLLITSATGQTSSAAAPPPTMVSGWPGRCRSTSPPSCGAPHSSPRTTPSSPSWPRSRTTVT